jgi:release factor glutamine methyltransferase
VSAQEAFEAPPDESQTRACARLARFLAGCGVEDAERDARMLLLAATGRTRAQLTLEPDAPLGAGAARRLCAFAARRAAREPVTRILGARGFWTVDLEVAPDVLDPRPDTETVVALALRLVASRWDRPLAILDLGAGSGAILCALLAELPAARGVAVDLSAAACAATRANLARLGLEKRAFALRGRWAQAIAARFDLVVSNPPYVRSGEIATLSPEVKLYDPRLALDGGADGLACYREIACELPRLLAEDGFAVLEAGAGQAAQIAALLVDARLQIAAIERDAHGHERAVAAHRSPGL